MSKIHTFPACLIFIYLLTIQVLVPNAEARVPTTVSVQNIRHWGAKDYTRIVIDLDSATRYEDRRLTGPDRILFDLSDTMLTNQFPDRTIQIGNALLKRIRLAQNQSKVVRVVLDLSAAADYSVSELHDPFRIVIDLRCQPDSHPASDSMPKLSEPCPEEIGPAPLPKLLSDQTNAAITSPVLKTEIDGKSKQNIYLLTTLNTRSQLPKNISTAAIQNIEYSPLSDRTRVILKLDSEARYESARLAAPDRIYFDISNSRLGRGFQNHPEVAGDRFLKTIRVAQNRSDLVRVVLHVYDNIEYTVSESQNPFCIIIDLKSQPGSNAERNHFPRMSKTNPGGIEPALISGLTPPRFQAGKPSPVFTTKSETYGKPNQQNYLLTSVETTPQPVTGLHTATIQDIGVSVLSDRTQVFVDLDSNVHYESGRLTGPDRIYFDISNAKLSSGFQNHALKADDQLLKTVRVTQNQSNVVRVVLYLSGKIEYRVSEFQNPFCLIIDLYGSSGHKRTLSESVAGAGPSGQKALQSLTPDQVTDGIIYVTQPEQPQSLAYIESASSPTQDQDQFLLTSKTPTKAKKAETSARQDVLPLTINGILTTGYYSSFSRGGGNGDQTINFAPVGATVNINGYHKSPDLLEYAVQTELNAGPQASDAGFIGGNGVRLNVTTLRKGAFPLTFRYSNVQLKDAYFGSLSQISSYTMNNRNKDLGLTAGVKLAGLPSLTLDLGRESVRSQSPNTVIPDYVSNFEHLNLTCTDQRWGWDFNCFAGRQRQTSDLFTPQGGDASSSLLQQKLTQFRFSARRNFVADSELYLEGGSQHTDNTVLDQPINLATRYLNANLRMFQRNRWKTALRAGYTSNIAGLLLTQLVGGLGDNGSVAPNATVLQPFQRTTSFFNVNGITSVDLPQGFGLYSSIDRTAVFTTRSNELDSKYLTTGGGMTYSRAFHWGSLSGQYGRTFGTGSVTGQSGSVLGQNYIVTAQPGKPDGLLFDFSVRGSDQSIRYDVPAQEHSLATEMGVGFPVSSQWRVRLGGGWQRGAFSNQGNDFFTKGYTARIGIEHPRFQLSGSLNSNIGNALQSYGQLFNGIGMETAFLTQMHVVPSDVQGITLTLHATPIRKLEFSALFSRSIQHLEGVVANDFQVLDINATFRYRRLQFVAGYFSTTQVYSSYFAAYPETQRGRFYIRISRPFGIR